MILNHVVNSTEYYNYGKIGDKIVSDSFSWTEDEEKDISPVLEILKKRSKRKYTYLITTDIRMYPLGTRDKYFKLWKGLSKEYGINIDETLEKGIETKRFYIYAGVAKIPQEQRKIAIRIMQKLFHTSCIVLSDENKNLDDLLNQYIEFFLEEKRNCVNFAGIINAFCVEDEVITAITGYNGRTINYFYFQEDEWREN